MLCDDLEGVQEGADISVYLADSCCHTAQTTIAL